MNCRRFYREFWVPRPKRRFPRLPARRPEVVPPGCSSLPISEKLFPNRQRLIDHEFGELENLGA